MPQADAGRAVLVLAAGGGTRLGGGKLLLPWKDRPLVAHAVEKALGVPDASSVTVVLGHKADLLQRCLHATFPAAGFPMLRTVRSLQWERGLSASLQCGIKAILSAPEALTVESVLVLLADMPLVREETLSLLCQTHNETMAQKPAHAATVPTFQGRRGNPAALYRQIFPLLLTLSGDTGARSLFAALGENILYLPVSDPGILRDVDTPEDYAALPAD